MQLKHLQGPSTLFKLGALNTEFRCDLALKLSQLYHDNALKLPGKSTINYVF